MGEIIIYKVGLAGEVLVQATDDNDAKTKALAYFATDPMIYIRILEIDTVITPAP